MSEAVIRNATTTFSIIEGPQLRNLDDMTVNGKPILQERGGNSQKMIARIYKEFSSQVDKAGKPFRLSRKMRSICDTDPYGSARKVSGPLLEEYLDLFFQYVEVVHSAPPQAFNSPRSTGGNQFYLRLLDKLSVFVGALLAQGRFVQPEMLTMEWID